MLKVNAEHHIWQLGGKDNQGLLDHAVCWAFGGLCGKHQALVVRVLWACISEPLCLSPKHPQHIVAMIP